MTDQASPELPVLDCYFLNKEGSGINLTTGKQIDNTENGFYWFHLRSDAENSVSWMRQHKLDEQVIESLCADETRPRTLSIAKGTLINLRGVNTNPGADPEDMVSIRIWFNDFQIISARKKDRRLLSVDDVIANINRDQGPKSPAGFVIMLVEHLANRIGDVVDTIDEELTRIETQSLNNQNVDIKQQLFNTRRQTAAIRRYLAPQCDALSELSRSRKALLESDAIDLQNQNDRITHYIEDLDLARERILVLLSELQSQTAEQQNSRMFLLSIVSAIFLPLSFVTGLFGMNVGGLPGLENSRAFYLLCGGMLFLAVLLLVFMRWKKWW